ncbi:MAG TPA: peptidylprolyl isomerase [Turneriella sp.]|nr:peptidylprolyl isomerase [Turneriella sp.]HMY10132.1 peptidylprolyl isomerase [Turneriella sp.]HNA78896.1 peptidylprolyl isomerase [Turneriella sp.]HNE19885.1 peptidylprolyl isomerase [Turneriella sp.]HNJ65778.1 peptidylprolyl isomerase [Turneriella sp.]
MQVARNKVVTISYELSESGKGKLEDGTLDYLHGFKNLMPALEKFLTDKKEGFSGKVEMGPRDAFGEFSQDMVMTIPKDQLEKPEEMQVGMQIELESEEGVIPALVTAVGADSITVDGNHPYAGKTLTFDIKVVAIRDASAEELAHGHAHGAHGHHH